MNATVYTYKMTFQTLTFRDNPRFQDGLYIMVVTELAENTVSRILYGPLTEDVINRFREGYMQAAQQMLEAAAILLPRADTSNLPPFSGFQPKEPADNPWGIDTASWDQKDKAALAMWASVRQPPRPVETGEILTAGWEKVDPNQHPIGNPNIVTAWHRRSPDGAEYWYALQSKTTFLWYWRVVEGLHLTVCQFKDDDQPYTNWREAANALGRNYITRKRLTDSPT